MDPLRFGAADHPDTARVLPGVVAGIGGYGNCLGLPNIGGEVVFDPCYQGNPLVNALCVGVLRHEDIHLANATGAGNKVVLFGARTGGDGIGGVSVLASRDLRRRDGPTKRPAVQVGDPFAEKVLIECCLELFAADLVEGIQDLGGAGLSCATSELRQRRRRRHARRARPGAAARPRRCAPEEILMSESQERMMAIVEPGEARRVPRRLREVGRRWPPCSARSPTTGRLVIDWHGEAIVDVRRAPSRTTARSTSARSPARPDQDALQADDPRPAAAPGDRRRAARARCCAWSASPNLAAKALGHRPVRPLRAGQHRARPARRRRHDPRRRGDRPRRRASPPTATAATPASTRTPGRSSRWPRRTATSPPPAPRPLAVTDCLNFGSPRGPRGDVAVRARPSRGLADGCLALGIPVTGGNVSFYNQTGDVADPPDAGGRRARRDRRRRAAAPRSGFARAGRRAAAARRRPATSSAARRGRDAVHGHLGGPPAGGRPGRRAARWPSAGRGGRDGCVTPRTTCPTAGWPRRWSSAACARDRGATRRGRTATRSSRCSASRPRRAVVSVAEDDLDRLAELADGHGRALHWCSAR